MLFDWIPAFAGMTVGGFAGMTIGVLVISLVSDPVAGSG